jgi:hypothetical protein
MTTNMAVKRAKKVQRRKQVVAQKRRAEALEASLPARVLRSAQAPIQRCLLTESLFEIGMGSGARRHPPSPRAKFVSDRRVLSRHQGCDVRIGRRRSVRDVRRRDGCRLAHGFRRSKLRPQAAARSCPVVAIDRFLAAPGLRGGATDIRRRERGRKRRSVSVRSRRQAFLCSRPERHRAAHCSGGSRNCRAISAMTGSVSRSQPEADPARSPLRPGVRRPIGSISEAMPQCRQST